MDLALTLFAVATLAGLVDAIAGGGGLITVPALLWSGLDPITALATNKAQGVFGSGTAAANFAYRGALDLRLAWPAVVCAYPNAMAVCGERLFWDQRKDVITNPALIVEVLSDSTEA